MDKNCDSVVDRHDFRELYDSLGLVSKEREYQRLLQLLGLQPGANLNYPVLPPRSIQRQDPQAEFQASQWVNRVLWKCVCEVRQDSYVNVAEMFLCVFLMLFKQARPTA